MAGKSDGTPADQQPIDTEGFHKDAASATPRASDPPEPGGPPEPGDTQEPATRPARKRRRVTTAPPPGSDPNPVAEPERHVLTENDDRLKAEKPPHY